MPTSKNNPLRDSRHPELYFPYVSFIRRPTSTDIRHPNTGKIYSRPYFWRVRNKPDGTDPDSGTEGELWYLVDITANVATWELVLHNASGDNIVTVTGDAGGAVPGDANDNLDLQGKVVANGANSKPLFFQGTIGSNLQEGEIQVATDRTGAPADTNDAGICSFDDTSFTVDANGYVTLKGGAGPTIDAINVDANTAPGTNPVVPDGNGEITVSGAAVAAHSVPVEIHSRAANAYNVEVQVGATVTGAPGNKNKAGLIQLESTHFSVDSDGYADSSVATAVTATPANADGAGIAQFDDAEFTVDSNGFVQLASGVGDGSWVFLASTTASSSSSVVFDNTYINSTYQHYVLVLKRITLNADNHSIRLFFSNDNGATFENTNYAPNTGRIALIAGFGNDTNEYGTSIAHMYDLEDASKKKTVTGYHHYVDNSGIYQTGRVDGAYNVAETINAIEIAPTVTTMNGQIVLYGVKES